MVSPKKSKIGHERRNCELPENAQVTAWLPAPPAGLPTAGGSLSCLDMAVRTHGAALVLALSLLAACTPNPDKLPTPSRNFYYVIEDDAKQLEYLKLHESERKSFLEQLGLWQKWLELSSEE